MPRQKESYTIVRLEKEDGTFEILVDPDNALKYKMGEKMPISKILAYEEVFKDWKKGSRASETELKKAFGTTDVLDAASRIMERGDLQITADQRRKLAEDRKRQIIDFISKNTLDPRTNMPHPAKRIELAIEQIGFPVDPFADAKQQAAKVIEKLAPVLPMKVGLMRVAIRLPGDLVGRAYGVIKSAGKMTKEEWLRDGSWKCEVELPTGLHADLIDRLNKLCGGRVELTPLG